jgi:hypothetical protein
VKLISQGESDVRNGRVKPQLEVFNDIENLLKENCNEFNVRNNLDNVAENDLINNTDEIRSQFMIRLPNWMIETVQNWRKKTIQAPES